MDREPRRLRRSQPRSLPAVPPGRRHGPERQARAGMDQRHPRRPHARAGVQSAAEVQPETDRAEADPQEHGWNPTQLRREQALDGASAGLLERARERLHEHDAGRGTSPPRAQGGVEGEMPGRGDPARAGALPCVDRGKGGAPSPHRCAFTSARTACRNRRSSPRRPARMVRSARTGTGRAFWRRRTSPSRRAASCAPLRRARRTRAMRSGRQTTTSR